MLQQEHTEESPWAGIIRAYVDKLLPDNWEMMDIDARREFIQAGENSFDQPEGRHVRDKVCALEVWVEAIGGQPKAMGRLQSMEISNVLRNLDGWEPMKRVARFGCYGVQRGYSRV